MQIFYEFPSKNIDITSLLLQNSLDGIITIPASDHERYALLADINLPLHKKKNRMPKSIIVINDTETVKIKHGESAFIDVSTGMVYPNAANSNHPNNIKRLQKSYKKSIGDRCGKRQNYIDELTKIQNTLNIKYGNFTEEYPEQLMAITYLNGNEKVLEIGGNIGRNSLIIGAILRQKNNDHNMVTMEPNQEYANQLRENRDNNNLKFHIENSAISKRQLIQKASDTIVSDVLLDGYTPVNSINWDELNLKYGINFDTLIIDCEGAFYYILIDMPEILNNVNLIIMENDYCKLKHKQYVDDVLTEKGFHVDYREAGGWGKCYAKFYEVWKR